MRNALPTLLAVFMAAAAVAQQAAPKAGDRVFGTDFELAEDRDLWSKAPAASWVNVGGRGHCLQVKVPPEQLNTSNMVRLSLDLTRYRGCRLLFECLAKADGVTKPPASYLGVKYMLHYASPSVGDFYRNQDDVFGSFDWKKLQFVVPLASDAAAADLNLGLQASSGTVWFDDLKVSVLRLPLPARPAPRANPPPAFKGHNLPRLRGVMSPNQFKDEDLRVLGQEWNANVIRWQMTRNWGRAGTERDLAEYDKWFAAELEDLDKVLEACGRYGLKVVVDMHSPPGGRYENHDVAIFHEKLYQDHWVALWEQVARRYKDHPVIWGYDLINEPVIETLSAEGLGDSLDGQVRVARAIRAIDPKMPIFIEAAQWDSPSGFRELQPVDLPNIVYQVHMYEPHQFTHQGVGSNPTGLVYPGRIGTQEWNKERLRQALQPVRDFQLAYNVHIYAGEFSAIRWGQGAAQYLQDLTDLFEEYGWDWSYHAYREWDGWSLEHGPEPQNNQPVTEPTDRMKVIRGWFAKNAKP